MGGCLLKAALALPFCFLLMSCGPKHSASVQNQKVTDDLVVSVLVGGASSAFDSQNNLLKKDCLQHLRSVACLSKQVDLGFDANCSPKDVTPQMLASLPQILKFLPPLHRQIFCHLNRLQIHPLIHSIAYADELRDATQQPIGTMIGIREDALSGNVNKDAWSWKEQLNFGLSKPDDPLYQISPQGPIIEESLANVQNVLVIHALVHEISHLVDFINHADSEDTCNWAASSKGPAYGGMVVCTVSPNSYKALSWPLSYEFDQYGADWPPASWKARYPWLSQLCYYSCKQTISPSHMGDVYASLRASSFMTSYSASHPMEDFAEASTVFLLKDQGFEQKIIGADGGVLFDTDQHWNSPQLKAKETWLANFYSRQDLKFKF